MLSCERKMDRKIHILTAVRAVSVTDCSIYSVDIYRMIAIFLRNIGYTLGIPTFVSSMQWSAVKALS